MKNSSEKHKKTPAVLVSLRTMLTAPYVFLIVLSITAVGVISFLNGQAAVNDVARQLGNETALGVNQHLATFLSVPHQINQMNAYAIQNGELDLNNTSSMQQHFLNQALIHTSITSIYFGSSQGGLVGGGREGADGSLYVTITENLESGDFQKFGLDATKNIVLPPLATVPNFDARTRPWYVGATEKGRETWSDIYILFTGQDMAIAASRPVYDGNNNLLGVVSVDIFLSQLSKYLETLSISPSGQVFIMERSGALIATSTGETLFRAANNNGTMERLYARDSQSAVIRQSESLLIQKYSDLKNIPTSEQQFEFTLEGEKQFMQFQSVRDPHGIDWILVVVIPESAFMERINKGNTLTMQLILITLIIAVATSVFFTSKITNRIQQLDSSAQSLALGEWGRELDTSTHITELNRLAISFNQMKEQLGRTLDTLTTEVEERKRAEKLTIQIAAELQVTLDTVTVGISQIKGRKVEWANAAHDEMFGYSNSGTHGMDTSLFYPNGEIFEQFRKEANAQLILGKTFSKEMQMQKQDGSLFWCSLTGRLVNVNSPSEGAIWMLQDITERRHIEEQLSDARDLLEQALERERHLARTDELTGIKNRRHIFELAELKFGTAQRYKQPLTMIMFDIDHFKKVNDTWGHVVGDQILIKVTQVVLAEMRNVDLLGRYGGEEFIILSPMTSAQQAYALAERIRIKVEALRLTTDKEEVSVTVSLGIVEMRHDSPLESVESMFNRADEAMYNAKQAGRNCTKILESN